MRFHAYQAKRHAYLASKEDKMMALLALKFSGLLELSEDAKFIQEQDRGWT